MGALFSKSEKLKSLITVQDKAILQLKQQRDRLKQYQKRIEQSLIKDRELARKCLQTGRKERAKLLLRKKKYQEKLLENTDIQLENLENLASNIEFAQIEQNVINGLKVGNETLKKIHDVLTIDKIERILDETHEGVEKQKEINEILSGTLTEEDEDAVLTELNELFATEVTNNENNRTTNTSSEMYDINEEKEISESLPDVPTDELPEIIKRKVNENSEDKILVEEFL